MFAKYSVTFLLLVSALSLPGAQAPAPFGVWIDQKVELAKRCTIYDGFLRCATKVPIADTTVEAVRQVEGVESVINVRRYSFTVYVGELFDINEISGKILKVLP